MHLIQPTIPMANTVVNTVLIPLIIRMVSMAQSTAMIHLITPMRLIHR